LQIFISLVGIDGCLNKVNEAYAWKCPVQSMEYELTGEILIYQATPHDAIHVQG
jgi:hypothetical protein